MSLQFTYFLRCGGVQEVDADDVVRVAGGQEHAARAEGGTQHLGTRVGPLHKLDGFGAASRAHIPII